MLKGEERRKRKGRRMSVRHLYIPFYYKHISQAVEAQLSGVAKGGGGGLQGLVALDYPCFL